MKDKRTNKTVSFSHVDAYEDELFRYAVSSSNGKFGPYVKRLIERDRSGASAVSPSGVPQSSAPVTTAEEVGASDGGKRKAAMAFL